MNNQTPPSSNPETTTTMLHIIFTESSLLLSKNDYQDWRVIQEEFEDYKASLGPWPEAEVSAYLDDEYPSIVPSAQIQVSKFLKSDALEVEVQFSK
jgi:hypothetical protein